MLIMAKNAISNCVAILFSGTISLLYDLCITCCYFKTLINYSLAVAQTVYYNKKQNRELSSVIS